MNFYTTLNLVKKHHLDSSSSRKLRRALGKEWGVNDKIPLTRILDANGMEDAIWALRAVPDSRKEERNRLCCLLALDFAEHVLFVFEEIFPGDDRLRQVIQAARDFVGGKAAGWDGKSACAAVAACWDATFDVVANNAARAVVRAVEFAVTVVDTVAGVAAGYAPWSANEIAVAAVVVSVLQRAADAAAEAAYYNNCGGGVFAASVAEREWQELVFRKYLESA